MTEQTAQEEIAGRKARVQARPATFTLSGSSRWYSTFTLSPTSRPPGYFSPVPGEW